MDVGLRTLSRSPWWELAVAAWLCWVGYSSVFYLGGQAWRNGESVYDRQVFAESYRGWNNGELAGLDRSVFVTPPTVAPMGRIASKTRDGALLEGAQ